MKKKVAVLGGGISGLSLAWKLAENGIPVEVIEGKDYIGGLAATIKTDGHKMDFGPHSVFSEDEEILATITGLFKEGIQMGVRDVRLYMSGKYLRYPLNAEDIVHKLGLSPSLKCFISFLIEKLKGAPKEGPFGPNMEQWSTHHFGKALHKLFFKPYTEQFWDVKCDELSPDCIPTYKQMSFAKTLKLLLTPKKRRDNYSIIDREMLPLYYPKEGFGAIPERMAAKLISAGGSVHTGLRATKVKRLKDSGFLVTATNAMGEAREFKADHLVSTIPINAFIKLLDPAPPAEVIEAAVSLKYLSLLILYIATGKKEILDCMYEYCLEKPYNRITDVGNFTLVPKAGRSGNMISIEQSCHLGDEWWTKEKEELFSRYIPHLEEEGLLKESDVNDIYLLKASHAYPMYLYGYRENFKIYTEYCDSIPDVSFCGRTGGFRYMDIDQCMKLAFILAEELSRKLIK